MGARRTSARRRAWVGLAVIVLSWGACDDGEPSADTGTSAAPDASTTSTADTTTTTTAGPGSELVGVWEATIPGPPEAAVTLRFRPDSYTIQREGSGSGGGGYAVDGQEIEFAANAACDVAATYTWSLEGETLTFTSVTEDPCGRVGVLDGVTYQRTE